MTAETVGVSGSAATEITREQKRNVLVELAHDDALERLAADRGRLGDGDTQSARTSDSAVSDALTSMMRSGTLPSNASSTR